jgi:hypothetical protein
MRKLLSIVGWAVVGAVLGGVLWWFLNATVQINNVGWLQMMPWPVNSWPCWSVASGILAGVLVIWSQFYRRRQTRQAEEVAQTLGLDFTAEVKRDELPGRSSLPVLQRVSWAGNLMTGEYQGKAVAVVDCVGVEGEGDSAHRVDRTVVLLSDTGSDLPEFTLRPLTSELSLLAGLGMRGIQFDARTVPPAERDAIHRFHKTYHLSPGIERLTERMKALDLKPIDDEVIRQAFPLEVVAFFARNPGWSVQAGAGLLAIWRGKNWYPARDRAVLLDQSLEVGRTLTGHAAAASLDVVLPAAPRSTSPYLGMARLLGAVLGGFIGFTAGSFLVLGVLMQLIVPLMQGNNPWAMLLIPLVFFGGLFLALIAGGCVGYLLAPLIQNRLESRASQQERERQPNTPAS